MYPSSTNNEPCKILKGSSSSSSPTLLPSAPPQFPDHDDNHFNYPSSPPPPAATITTGIPVSSSTALDEQDPRLHSPVPWSSGLCDCCDDLSTCCLTCWCPCVTFGRIAEIVDRGSTSCGVSAMLYTMILCLTGCSCLYSCFYRSKLRGQYFLEENPCTDCCIHCCCEECSLCQEYRELKNRGFDMSIGWHGNMERRKRGVPVAPIVQGGMSRS